MRKGYLLRKPLRLKQNTWCSVSFSNKNNDTDLKFIRIMRRQDLKQTLIYRFESRPNQGKNLWNPQGKELSKDSLDFDQWMTFVNDLLIRFLKFENETNSKRFKEREEKLKTS